MLTLEFLDTFQANQLHYPTVFQLAMDIIPIQASSVPCERVFSSGKETMAPRRRQISAHLMESLQMLKFSIRKGRPLNFTEGMKWDDELKDFEYMARAVPAEDPESYHHNLEKEDDSDDLEDIVDQVTKTLKELEESMMGLDDSDSDSNTGEEW